MNRSRQALVSLLVLFSLLFSVACTSKAAKALEKVELGQKYLTELNYTEAIASFTEAINLDPENIPAYMGRAQAYCATEQYAEAKADYTIVIEKTAEQPYTQATAFVGRAEASELTQSIDEALTDYETAAGLLPNIQTGSIAELTEALWQEFQMQIYSACARLNIVLGRYDAAQRYFELMETLSADSTVQAENKDESLSADLVYSYYFNTLVCGANGDMAGYANYYQKGHKALQSLTEEQLISYGLNEKERKNFRSYFSIFEFNESTTESLKDPEPLTKIIVLKYAQETLSEPDFPTTTTEYLKQLVQDNGDGLWEFRRRDYLAAEQKSAAKISQYPMDITAYRVHIASSLKLGKYQQAFQDCCELIELGKNPSLSWLDQCAALGDGAYWCDIAYQLQHDHAETARSYILYFWKPLETLEAFYYKTAEDVKTSLSENDWKEWENYKKEREEASPAWVGPLDDTPIYIAPAWPEVRQEYLKQIQDLTL